VEAPEEPEARGSARKTEKHRLMAIGASVALSEAHKTTLKIEVYRGKRFSGATNPFVISSAATHCVA